MANGFLNWLLGVPEPMQPAHSPGQWAAHMESARLAAMQAGDAERRAHIEARIPALNAASGYTPPTGAEQAAWLAAQQQAQPPAPKPGLMDIIRGGKKGYDDLNKALTPPKR